MFHGIIAVRQPAILKNDPGRLLIAETGLDGDSRGVKTISLAFCDVGMEVINAGIRRIPPVTIAVDLQEDVEVM